MPGHAYNKPEVKELLWDQRRQLYNNSEVKELLWDQWRGIYQCPSEAT